MNLEITIFRFSLELCPQNIVGLNNSIDETGNSKGLLRFKETLEIKFEVISKTVTAVKVR